MDFSSVPVYLDPPNWHPQQSNHNLLLHHHHHHQQQISNESSQSQSQSQSQQQQLLPLPTQFPLTPQPSSSHVGSAGGSSVIGSIRRGSMADRARLANIPLPETALKCPRCESSNTKFCYFNNYSLSQPRHFCKTCRRYWTRGGALRNVPVGGGCRRNNKKNKSRRSKSPTTTTTTAVNETGHQLMRNNSNSITSTTENIIGHLQLQPQQHNNPQFSFMSSLQNLGLNFNEIQGQGQIGNCDHDQQQYHPNHDNPISGSLESPYGLLYPFQISEGTHSVITSSARVTTQLPPVKIEETQVLNLLKPSNNLELVNSENNNNHHHHHQQQQHQFWGNGNGAWTTDLSSAALSSSSSGHLSCDHHFNH